MSGRPRQFDREEALDRAVEVFWQKGYAGASMADLIEHMGVSRQSLYNTFGDKRQLFLAVLDRYCERAQKAVGDEMSTGMNGGCILDRIRGLFRRMSQSSTCTGPKACLMAMTSLEVAPFDDDVEQRVRAHLQRVEDGFTSAIELAIKRGEIAPGRAPRAIARHLCNTMHGLGVMGRGGASREELDEVVDVALSVLG